MRLFIAEDDHTLADALSTSLKKEGFQVDWREDGEAAERALVNSDYDIAIVDIGLPKVDGLTLLKRVRILKPTLPILILTALDGLENRVEGLNAGADDYLSKPFEFPELAARLRALLRRSHLLPPTVQQFGVLKYDRAAQRAWCQDQPLELSARELAVLDVLMAQRDHVVTKEQIAQALQPDAPDVPANAIEVYVSRVRKKLEPHGMGIRTVRGLGYLLEEQPRAG